MALENGHYAPVTAKRVTHWQKPDKNGDGEPAYEDLKDQDGNILGRNQVTDANGNAVHHYEAPEGFRNIPSFDGTSNYVKVDHNGRPWRHPVTGEALCIKPGQTVVEHANGDFIFLNDDYSRYLFERSHEPVSAPEQQGPPEPRKSASQLKAEKDAQDRAEFEAWRKNRVSSEEPAA